MTQRHRQASPPEARTPIPVLSRRQPTSAGGLSTRPHQRHEKASPKQGAGSTFELRSSCSAREARMPRDISDGAAAAAWIAPIAPSKRRHSILRQTDTAKRGIRHATKLTPVPVIEGRAKIRARSSRSLTTIQAQRPSTAGDITTIPTRGAVTEHAGLLT